MRNSAPAIISCAATSNGVPTEQSCTEGLTHAKTERSFDVGGAASSLHDRYRAVLKDG